MAKELATERIRVYLSTSKKFNLRKLHRIGGRILADVAADVVRKAELYEKEHPESKKSV